MEEPRPASPQAAAGPIVAVEGLTCRFGAVTAVDDLTFAVQPGELLALLGPSGCGKTTTLRLIAGFERPDAGSVAVHGRVVADTRRFVPPEKRRVGVVFQDYALFPHLSVEQNVAYGLARGDGRAARVGEMLDLVGLGDKRRRRPHELSGGEQQRVAIARALAPDPALVLLDEPFSNLDASLRARVREEVRDILAAAEATAIFVTHDQEEALSLAHRVAVMRAGVLLQIDTAEELYANPADAFVATFVGDADLIAGEADHSIVRSELGTHPLAAPADGPVDVVLRPETIRLRLDGSGQATVARITYFGHDQIVEARLPSGARVRSRTGPGESLHPGDRVAVQVLGPLVAFPDALIAPVHR